MRIEFLSKFNKDLDKLKVTALKNLLLKSLIKLN